MVTLRAASVCLLAFVIGTAGCGGGGSSSSSTGGGGGTASGWTVLVYVAADNNLEPFALMNLEEMAAVGSSTGLNIVAEVDRAPTGQYTEPNTGLLNIAAWTTAKRFLVKNGSLQQLADLGEIDTAAPSNLASFIGWGVHAYPAAHYMLILWDHGGGWQGFGVDETIPGGSGQDMMGLLRIQTGLHDGLQQAGIAKFDVLGFDACMMATFEVAEVVKPYANLLLASEETEPGHGWDYSVLSGAASLDALSLSKKFVDGFQAIANTAPWNDGANITLSIIDLSKLGPIETALSQTATDYATTAAMPPLVSSVATSRDAALKFGDNPDPSVAFNLLDAGDLFGRLTGLGADATALKSAVLGAVAYKVNGSAYTRATGMSIYFPPSSAYYDSAVYDSLPGMDSWRTFVKAYYAAASTAVVPAFAAGTYNATTADVTMDGLLTPGSLANVTSSSIVFGIPGANGDAWLYGDADASTYTDTNGDHVTGSWDYSFLHLYQTTPVAHDEYGYVSVRQVDANTAAVIIPMSYYPSGSTVAQGAVRYIVIDLGTSSITSDVYYVETNGVLGQLNPASGSTLRARVGYLANSSAWNRTWVDATTSGGLDATAPVGLEFLTLSTGASFFTGLHAVNAAGLGGWIATPVNPPPAKP